MGASEPGIVDRGDMKVEQASAVVQLPDPDKESEKEDELFHRGLSKQNSILSLTLEEIQFRSGKSFGSMNMDEFLASVWSTEDNQSLTSQTELNNHEPEGREGSASTGKPALARRGSFSVPTPLCNKTVDEVWYEIHKDDHHLDGNRHPLDADDSSADNLELPPCGQQTFGEMTLEDFLIKSGVMQEARMFFQQKSATNQNQPVSFPNSVSPYGPPGFTSSGPSGNGFPAAAYLTGWHNSNNYRGEVMGEFIHKRRESLSEAAGLKKRRIVEGPAEVVVERRQRRMIKNRESAARSRARKQAYTVELEVQLNQLKEENETLKRIVEESEQKRRKEVLKRKYPLKVEVVSERVKAMRRTLSGAW